jgi:hypothetical protein
MSSDGRAYPAALKAKVRDEWLSGQYTFDQLEKKWEVSKSTIQDWRAREGWDDMELMLQEEADRLVQKTQVERIARLQEDDYKMWELFRMQIMKWMRHWGKTKNKPPPLVQLDMATKIYERIQKGRRVALGVERAEQRQEQVTRVEILYDGLNQAIDDAEKRQRALDGTNKDAPKIIDMPRNGDAED